MWALVKEKSEEGLWMKRVPIPEVGPNDVKIKIHKTAICGTDVHIYQWNDWAQHTIPIGLTAGHEYVGEIVEKGEGVQGFKIGDLVSGEGHITCGKCRNCLEGHKENCKDAKGVGVNRNGAFAEYLVIPSSNVWPCNPNIPEEMYAIFDPFGNATHTALSFEALGEDVLIAGAGPINGPIQAAVFGWVPVLLWILIGGIFFGAVTDFGALYASVKNEGKSMGLLIEKYIGKTGKKLFLLFCWLFTLIVIAAFADMVAGTFNAYETVDGVTKLSAQATVNGAAGSISLLFIAFAVVFGLLQKKLQWKGWKEMVLGLACTVAAFAIGMNVPLVTSKATWTYLVFAYIFLAAVLPMWLLMQPRDFMTTFMFAGMILGAVVGLVVAHPKMNLPMYTGFHNAASGDLFPILFVTVACGAVSGFHSPGIVWNLFENHCE